MSMRQLKITKSITNRDTQSFEKYLHEISKIALITPEEEIILAQRIKGGDKEALLTLTRANLRFVVSVAKQYQFKGLSLQDLINEGNIGLIKAAQRFDETKGFKFISYAVWWVRQSIIQAVNDQARLVRLPSNKLSLGKRIQKAETILSQEYERLPSDEEIADYLKITLRDVSLLVQTGHHQSLDKPIGEGLDTSFVDLLETDKSNEADTDVIHTKSLEIEMARCLKNLPEIQQQILCSYFGIGFSGPVSLQEIGQMYNLTAERVRQLKEKGLKQMRTPQKTALLKSYLP